MFSLLRGATFSILFVCSSIAWAEVYYYLTYCYDGNISIFLGGTVLQYDLSGMDLRTFP